MFGSILKAAVGVVTLPIDIAVDVVTLGGELTDGECKTAKKLGSVLTNIEDAVTPDSSK